MIVTPFVGRKGDVICSVFGKTGLFDIKAPLPEAGKPIEIMICTVVYPKEDDYSVAPIKSMIVRPVFEADVLVEHDGFETFGSMCSTTARLLTRNDRLKGVRSLTPGRTPVYEADNVSVGWYGKKMIRPVPGRAWVSTRDMRSDFRRIAGVPDISELRPDIIERIRA